MRARENEFDAVGSVKSFAPSLGLSLLLLIPLIVGNIDKFQVQAFGNFRKLESPTCWSKNRVNQNGPSRIVGRRLQHINNAIRRVQDEDDLDCNSQNEMDGIDRRRRNMLLSMPLAVMVQEMITGSNGPAYARGLVQFPCADGLANTYHCLRVGTTLLEEEGMWSTNPLFLTNREDALSQTGMEQVLLACQQLALSDRAPTVVKYSLAASCIDTSNIVQRELKLGRERIIPEFTFLDPRAIGGWDMMSKAKVEPALWALDHDDAGVDGLGGRPPANEDGTPHETLADQATRLRQVLSILESQYSGDTILLIFPDGTGPALLSAMIAGIPYDRVHQLEYATGEVRFDVTYESTRKLWEEKKRPTDGGSIYDQKIQEGRENLVSLRASDPENGGVGFVNLKDLKLENERLAVEEVYEAKNRLRRLAEAEDKSMRKQRQQQIVDNAEPSNMSSILSVGAGLLAIAGIGVAVSRDDSTNSDVTVKSDVGGSDLIPAADNATTVATSIMDISTESGSSLYAAIGPQGTRVNGDRKALFPPPVAPLDPKEAAEKAMQEYMDRDDGGTDWLRVMADIIEEPEEEEDLVSENKVQQLNHTAFQ